MEKMQIAERHIFQSTLPVWGATEIWLTFLLIHSAFQSTLPVWGATRRKAKTPLWKIISIHAPRVGSDQQK